MTLGEGKVNFNLVAQLVWITSEMHEPELEDEPEDDEESDDDEDESDEEDDEEDDDDELSSLFST